MCRVQVSSLTLGLLVLSVLIDNDVSGSSQGSEDEKYENRIVGGEATTIQDVPYQVFLLILVDGLNYPCGGSIISSRWILTAAHCMMGATSVQARAGSTDSRAGGKVYRSSVFTLHPLFNNITFDYDYALINIVQGIALDGVNITTVPLPEQGSDVPADIDVLISGWGDTTEGGTSPRRLRSVTVPTVSDETCRQAYGNSSITPRMFCAGETGKDSCQGDSGGPVVDTSSGLQLGVVSYGIGCAREGYPGVNAKVSAVRDWIDTVTLV